MNMTCNITRKLKISKKFHATQYANSYDRIEWCEQLLCTRKYTYGIVGVTHMPHSYL